jgi:hypothetical protein
VGKDFSHGEPFCREPQTLAATAATGQIICSFFGSY